MKPLDADISQRIALLRYLMIFGIVVLHTPLYVPLSETGTGVFDFIKALFQHAIFRASVPVLTFISGYLLFRSQTDKHFRKLVAKKTKTILIPLVLFNIPVALGVYLIQANDVLDHEFSKQLHPFIPAIWIDAITGLFSAPINYPLNFLRDLYLLSLLSPILGLLLQRTPWTGLTITFVIFWFNFDGQLILRNTMPIVFYLGGLVAIKRWDLRRLDQFAVPLLLVFLTFSIAIIVFQIENRNYLRLLAPILIWPAASLLVNTKAGEWLARLSKYSFLTFLIQGPLLLLAFFVYQHIFPNVPYGIFWTIAPIFVAAVSVYAYMYSRRLFPKTMKILLGGR